jgi:hypothetical protein
MWRLSRFYLPTLLKAGVIYLSGDDSETQKYEGWDPMFARWPKWSESFIYTQILEDGVAWWTNLTSLNLSASFSLSPLFDMTLDYHRLGAAEPPPSTSTFPGGSGTARGDLFIGKLSWHFGANWSGHLLWEGFSPGDYYFDGADSYAWVRAEVMFRY